MIKEREQKIINKMIPKRSEFDKCVFCDSERTKNILDDSPGFYQLAVYDIKEIDGREYQCANFFCKTCKSRWLGDWYLNS